MQVVKQSAIYLGSSILNKIIPFLLLPVLTKYLSPSEYGTLAIFQLMVTLYSAFISMNSQTNVSKNFFNYSQGKMAELIGNILFIVSLSSFFFLVVTSGVAIFFDEMFSIPSAWIQIMPLLSFMQMVNTVNLTVLRNEGKAYLYGMFEVANTVVIMGITIVLLVVYHYGWYSQAIGISVAYFVFFVLGIVFMSRRGYLSLRLNKSEMVSILKISLPLIPHALGGIVIIMSDRLFIEKMVNLEMVGIYSVGYMFGMIVMVFTDAFIKAWSPWFYKSLAHPNNYIKRKIVKYTYLYIAGVFSLAVLVSIVSEFIFPYFVDEKYYVAKEFILWVALGYAMRGVYQIYSPYLVHIGKTSFLATSTLVAALVNLLMNYILIKYYGAIGAAYATIIAFFIAGLLVFWYQSMNYEMPWLVKGERNA